MIRVKQNLFLILLLTFANGNAQLPFYGKVVDSETKEGIPFVNIGFFEQAQGTTTDENGGFVFDFRPKSLPSDAVLQVSSLGYTTKKIPLTEIQKFIDNSLTIYLEPTNVALDEVVLYNDGQEFIADRVGYSNFDENHFGYWKGTKALGGELATRIIAKEGTRKLHKLKFLVVQPPADSLLLRINIYDDDGGISRYPGTNLNKTDKNILCKVYSYSKHIQVDLDPYEIVVEDDFIVSLELVKYYVKTSPEFALAASFEPFGSFRRLASQDKWEKFSNINMAYQLETSLLVSRQMAERFKKSEIRKDLSRPKISGTVFANNDLIKGVLVKNLRTGESVLTDNFGKYKLSAKKGDLLSFQKKGFQTYSIEIEKKDIVNIHLKKQLNQIDDKGLKPAIPLN